MSAVFWRSQSAFYNNYSRSLPRLCAHLYSNILPLSEEGSARRTYLYFSTLISHDGYVGRFYTKRASTGLAYSSVVAVGSCLSYMFFLNCFLMNQATKFSLLYPVIRHGFFSYCWRLSDWQFIWTLVDIFDSLSIIHHRRILNI